MEKNPVRTVIQRLGREKWFATAFKGIAPPVDRILLKATKGHVAMLSATGLPTLLLTTTGCKSGEPRTSPLLYAARDGSYIVAGSNWGQANHPAWSGNLLAEPAATVQIKGRTSHVRARLIEGEERDELWNSVLLETWPGYEIYAARSGRVIRIFALEPAFGG